MPANPSHPGPERAGRGGAGEGDPADDIVFPRTSGQISGYLGLVLAVAGAVFAVGWVPGIDGWRLLAFSLLLAVLVYALLLRPRIFTRAGALHLVNPFSETVIPIASLSEVFVRTVTYAVVRPSEGAEGSAGPEGQSGRRHTAVAIGRGRRDMVRLPEGVRPGLLGLAGNRLDDYTRAQTEGQTRPGPIPTADLLEETMAGLIERSRAGTGSRSGGVVRSWAWPLIVPAVVLAVAFAVTLLG